MSRRRPSSSASELPAIAAVVVAAILFGTSGTARELGPDAASALSVGALRIAVGSIVLWAVVFARRAVHAPPTMRDLCDHRHLFVIGAMGVATYTPLFFVAVERSGVAVGTIVTIASGPFFAAALDWRVRGIRPRAEWVRGTVVTVAGATALVLAARDTTASVDLLGIAAALGAGLGYATYAVTAKTTIDRGVAPTAALAVAFTAGAAAVGLLAVRSSFAWVATGSGALMALYLGVVATGVAYVLFGFGLQRLSSSSAVTLVLAEPVTAALLAVVVLDEAVPPIGWLGVGAVLVGLWLVGRAARSVQR